MQKFSLALPKIQFGRLHRNAKILLRQPIPRWVAIHRQNFFERYQRGKPLWNPQEVQKIKIKKVSNYQISRNPHRRPDATIPNDT